MAISVKPNRSGREGQNVSLVLPPDYEPFERLMVAGSMFQNVRVLIKAGNIVPLLIGRGTFPMIWLRASIDDKEVSLVERNVSHHPSIMIDFTTKITSAERSSPMVTVRLRGTPEATSILRVHKISDDEAVVTQIDLRPVGIEFFGEMETLNIGSNKLQGNTFSTMGVAISIGK